MHVLLYCTVAPGLLHIIITTILAIIICRRNKSTIHRFIFCQTNELFTRNILHANIMHGLAKILTLYRRKMGNEAVDLKMDFQMLFDNVIASGAGNIYKIIVQYRNIVCQIEQHCLNGHLRCIGL